MEYDLSFYEKSNLKWLKDNTLFLVLSGSNAYGTSIPGVSDIDLRGICFPPKEYFISCFHKFEQFESKTPDITIFNIQKWFNLASKVNPNVLEFIFTEPEDIISMHPIFQQVLDRRVEFLSKRVNYTYKSYAFSQMQRLKLHKQYLLNPPKKKPERSDFKLKDKPSIGERELNYVNAAIKKQLDKWNPELSNLERSMRIEIEENISGMLMEICGASIYLKKSALWREAALQVGISENIIMQLEDEKKYEFAMENWDKYENWLKTRNPKRAELEKKYLFDTKFGSHVFRLLYQGKQILDTSMLKVRLPKDIAETVLCIRNGGWTADQLEEYTEKQYIEFDESYKNSKLPYSTNEKMLDELCQSIICELLHI